MATANTWGAKAGGVADEDDCATADTALETTTELTGEGLLTEVFVVEGAAACLVLLPPDESGSAVTEGIPVGVEVDGSAAVGCVVGACAAVVSPEAPGAFGSVVGERLSVGVAVASAVGDADPELLRCAPPLLLTVTPGAICVLDDVAPEGVDVVVVTGSLPVGDALVVDVEPGTLVAALVDADGPVVEALDELVADSPVDVPLEVVVEPVELADDDSVAVSALARPGKVTPNTPTPKTAARAPTRPM